MKRFIKIAASFSVVALAISGCSANADGANGAGNGSPKALTPVTLLVTQAAWSSSYSFLAVAQERGYFADEGLAVEFVNFPGGTITATQLEQGGGDAALMSPEPLVIGRDAGNSFKSEYFANVFRRSHFGMAAPQGSTIKSAADLEGATVGVVSLASAGVQIAQAMAEGAGIDPASLKFIEIGAGPQAISAVKSGVIDALSLFDTQYQLMKNNGVNLQLFRSDFVDELTGGGFAALPKTIDEKPQLLTGLARAAFKGMYFCELNAEACVRDLWAAFPTTKVQGLADDVALANDVSIMSVRLNGTYALNPDEKLWGSFPTSTWKTFVDYMKNSGQIVNDVNPDSLYTDALIEGINDFDRAAVEADAANA